jgi:YggT family protein
VNSVEREQRIASFKLTQLIWLMFGLLVALIGLRVGLRLIGANPANPFAALVYGLTDIFLWPFVGLTGTPGAGGMVLEIHAIIAMIVYALIGWAIVRLVWILLYRPADTAVVHDHAPRETTVVREHHPHETTVVREQPPHETTIVREQVPPEDVPPHDHH